MNSLGKAAFLHGLVICLPTVTLVALNSFILILFSGSLKIKKILWDRVCAMGVTCAKLWHLYSAKVKPKFVIVETWGGFPKICEKPVY